MVLAMDLKQWIKKEDAWLAPNRKYYSSEQAYKKLKRKQANAKYYKRQKGIKKMAERKKQEAKKKLNVAERLAHQNCVQHMYDWMGYPASAKMPKFFYGLLGQWHNSNNYSYEVILETMYFCDDMVEHISKKEFESDSNKIRYICAIVRDHLNDGLKQFARKQKAIQDSQRQTDTPTEEEINNFTSVDITPNRDALNNVMEDFMGDLF